MLLSAGVANDHHSFEQNKHSLSVVVFDFRWILRCQDVKILTADVLCRLVVVAVNVSRLRDCLFIR